MDRMLASTVRRQEGGLLVRHVGRYQRTNWREDATFKWIFVPNGRYAVESQRFTTSLAAGQFLVLNPGTRHRHLGLRGEKRLAELKPELVREAARALGADLGWLRRGPIFPELRHGVACLGGAVDDLGELALALVELHIRDRPPTVDHAAVARALTTIEEAYAEPLTLERLAAEAGMERFAFAHAFRRVVGLSPYAHLVERRLRAAAALLRDTDQTVLEIALASGFPSVSSLNRGFRRAFGLTPTAYRAKPRIA
jgi:AraC-like DNA-binding protein